MYRNIYKITAKRLPFYGELNKIPFRIIYEKDYIYCD